MNKANVLKLFETLEKFNPNPKIELAYKTPFQLLVAVILSAQSTDKGVNKATKTLFEVAGTPQAMVELGEEGLKTYIKTIGLYNSKAKHIMKTAHILVDQFKGEVPGNRKDLEGLPGVGRKSANVILNSIFKEPAIAVDTHIFRVSNRTGLAKGKTPLEVEKKLLEIVPDRFRLNAHHWLVLHGRYICLARKPKCEICPIRAFCEYFKEHGLQSEANV